MASCTSLPKDMKWEDTKVVMKNLDKLQTGDIIVKNKIWSEPISWVGHSAVMVNDSDIGDYPKIGVNYYQVDAYSWLNEEREVIVLRYNNFDENFKNKFIENSKKYSDRQYRPSINKNGDKSFYCSKYVWFIYKKTAEDLGYKLDIDSDSGLAVLPYDFLNSKELYQVVIE
ncbi:MAG: YiiX/YebB-like N1pC/P60 family cysteine hydrolase [Cetobacterium sp.]